MEYRYKQLNFRVTDSEYEIIQKKMKLSGIKKPTAYLRKMAMDGYVIRLDLSGLTEILRLARINSNNLNQVARGPMKQVIFMKQISRSFRKNS